MQALSTTCCESYELLGQSTVVRAAADDEVPALLITLILFMNWCYTQ